MKKKEADIFEDSGSIFTLKMFPPCPVSITLWRLSVWRMVSPGSVLHTQTLYDYDINTIA